MKLRLHQMVEIRAETANGVPSICVVGMIKQLSHDGLKALFQPVHVGGMQDDLPDAYWVEATECRVHIPKHDIRKR